MVNGFQLVKGSKKFCQLATYLVSSKTVAICGTDLAIVEFRMEILRETFECKKNTIEKKMYTA